MQNAECRTRGFARFFVFPARKTTIDSSSGESRAKNNVAAMQCSASTDPVHGICFNSLMDFPYLSAGALAVKEEAYSTLQYGFTAEVGCVLLLVNGGWLAREPLFRSGHVGLRSKIPNGLLRRARLYM